MHAATNSNTYAIYGAGQDKDLTECVAVSSFLIVQADFSLDEDLSPALFRSLAKSRLPTYARWPRAMDPCNLPLEQALMTTMMTMCRWALCSWIAAWD